MNAEMFHQKPEPVEAVQVTHDNMADVAEWCGGTVESAACCGDGPPYWVRLDTPEGSRVAGHGNYVARDAAGALSVWSPGDFEATYEAAS